jgi:hypothetical protein
MIMFVPEWSDRLLLDYDGDALGMRVGARQAAIAELFGAANSCSNPIKPLLMTNRGCA